jgi:S1-C subfamily serine protease
MNEPSWKVTARTIVLSVLVGGAAGVFASAMTSDYLSDYALQLGNLTEPLRLAEQRPRSVPQSYQEAVKAVRERSTTAVAQFYDPVQNAPANGFVPYDTFGVSMLGAVLTSDGWIVTRVLPDSGLTAQKIALYAIVVGEKAYTVDQVVPHPDGVTFFVKVSGQNLPVMAFGSGWEVQAGEQVFVLASRESILPEWVSSVEFDGGRVHLDTDLPRELVLSGGEGQRPGASVVNAAGELVGIVSANAIVQPIDEILPLFHAFLRDEKIAVPKLGVSVLDLAHAVAVPQTESHGLTAGALIVQNGVLSRSAAAVAGLVAGDVILTVDGDSVNADRTLQEHMIQFTPGDQVTLGIQRGAQKTDVEVTLGSLE